MSQCHIKAIDTALVRPKSLPRLQEDQFVKHLSDIRQRREHRTCDAALNRRSTAAELGSVALLLRNAIAIVGKANWLLTVSDLAAK